MKLHKLLFLSFAFFLFTGPAAAQERRTAAEYIQVLETERRVSGLQVARVVDALNLKPGQHICDLGSGSGLFTRPMAQAVGSQGVVYAVDVDPDLLKHVVKTAQEQKINNIKPVLGGEADPKLPEPVDLIAIIDTLHHIPNSSEYLKGLRRYLKPGGRIAIIDFSKTWPAGHEKMVYKQEDLDKWMKAAGYTLVTQHYFLDNDFFVIYQ